MNTTKQINVMIGMLMVLLVSTTLYFVWDSSRESTATARQLEVNAERGGALFALYCSSCHGITGTGALERAGLPGAVLNDPSNRPATAGEIASKHLRFNFTIRCGRIGTLMPPWAVSQGGALNDFQIDQLLALITGTMPTFDPDNPNEVSLQGWASALESANHHAVFDPAKDLEKAVGASDTTIVLNTVADLTASTADNDVLLRIEDDPVDPAYELVKIISVDEKTRQLVVERGASGTKAAEHQAGAEILKGAAFPPTSPLTGESDPAPCGQRKFQPPTATPGPPVPVSGNVTVSIGDNFFDFSAQQNPNLSAAAGATVNFSLTNKGTVIHNMRTSGADGVFQTDDDQVSNPEVVQAGAQATLSFSFATAGKYAYRCDFHPTQMTGDIVVE